jgi:hypothetical protein
MTWNWYLLVSRLIPKDLNTDAYKKEEDHFTINPCTQNGFGMNDPYDKPKN